MLEATLTSFSRAVDLTNSRNHQNGEHSGMKGMWQWVARTPVLK